MKQLSVIGTLALLLLAVTAIVPQSTPQLNAETAVTSEPTIVEKLREIVTIRQKAAESNFLRLANGKGETDGRFDLALAEARLELARELGQRNEQVDALKDALKVYQRHLEDAKKDAAVGVGSLGEVEAVRATVLMAEVRLLRAQSGSK